MTQQQGARGQGDTRRSVGVVGGGIAGLVAASAAARAGARVTVFEAVRELGGRARTRVEDGFCFNMGPHALYRKGVGAGVLEQLGVEPAGAPAPLGGALALREGRYELLPAAFGSLLRTGLLDARDKLETARFLVTLGRMDASRFDRTPLGQAIDAVVKRPRVRALAHALARLSTYANAPESASGGAVLAQIQLALGGVRYLDGGWQPMVEAIAEHARTHSAVIVTGARVRAVHEKDAGFEIAADAEEAGHFDAVVLALPPREAARLVPDEAKLQRMARAALPARIASLDQGLLRLPDSHRLFALGIDLPLYASVHSETARLAPPGAALVHASRYLRPDEELDRGVLRKELEGLLDGLQPGWREHQGPAHFQSSLVAASLIPTASDGGLAGRPPTRLRSGLYLAGDWVGSEGLLVDAALASGWRAGGEAAARERS